MEGKGNGGWRRVLVGYSVCWWRIRVCVFFILEGISSLVFFILVFFEDLSIFCRYEIRLLRVILGAYLIDFD